MWICFFAFSFYGHAVFQFFNDSVVVMAGGQTNDEKIASATYRVRCNLGVLRVDRIARDISGHGNYLPSAQRQNNEIGLVEESVLEVGRPSIRHCTASPVYMSSFLTVCIWRAGGGLHTAAVKGKKVNTVASSSSSSFISLRKQTMTVGVVL
jgi:hypothetical protein